MNKENGRSMVEMLGVLAIVGVLSAGALAGYSKAMFQHKLNQFTDAHSQLLQNYMALFPKLEYDTTQTTYHADTIKAMNMIPEGITYYDSTFLQDMFYNKIKPNISKSHVGGITYHFASTDGGKMLCRQLFIIARENSRDLYFAYSDNGESAARGDDKKASSYFYGDSFCNGNNICLSQMTIDDMTDVCEQCDYSECRVFIKWK